MKSSLLFFVLMVTYSVTNAADSTEAAPEAQYESPGIRIPAATADEPIVELSFSKAAAYLEQGALAWTREHQCISCHTNGTYLYIRPALTRSLGPPSDEVRSFFVERLAEFQKMEREVLRKGTRPAGLIYLAAGLGQWDEYVSGNTSDETSEALELVLEIQNEDGTWGSADCWPPFESSAYQVATMAAAALAAVPDWTDRVAGDRFRDHIERLRLYLQNTTPPHEYARVLKLWTSVRFDGILSEDEREQIFSMVLKKQRPDGGWTIRDFARPEEWGRGNRAERLQHESDDIRTTSDGHMTGLALIVLQQAGSGRSAGAIQRGVEWLKKNQRESGRWWTRSLNTDKPHYITFSGTAYPLLALQLYEL